jgi:signal transduction histidine kinase
LSFPAFFFLPWSKPSLTAPFSPSTQLALLKALGEWSDQTSDQPILSCIQAEALLKADSHLDLWVDSSRPSNNLSDSKAAWLSKNLLSLLQNSPAYCNELHLLKAAAHRALQLKLLRNEFQKEIARSKQHLLYHFAYGLSHEINNPLANISTRAQMLLNNATNPKDRHALAVILDQVQRAHEMIGDLMQCSQDPHLQLAWVDVRSCAQECYQSFENAARRQATELTLQLPSQPVLLRTDSKLLKEILCILLRNALEALANHGSISLDLTEENHRIQFRVIDSGKGLSLEARKHAMDPFYSGREAGRGLGMGLSKASHYARFLQASLSLESHTNAGCVACLEFKNASETQSPQ